MNLGYFKIKFIKQSRAEIWSLSTFQQKNTDVSALEAAPWYRKQGKNASLPQNSFLATAAVPNRVGAHFSRVALRFLFKSSRIVSLFNAEQRPPQVPETAAPSSSWTI